MPKSLLHTALLLTLITGLLTGCTAPPALLNATPAPGQPSQLTPVVLGLGYIPSVQFAPYYVAQDKGFFAAQGLDVTFRHGSETDFLALVAVNQMPFVIASGEQVILGRSQGLPVTYVLPWYYRFPVGVMSLAEKELDTPQSLEGQRVGIPGMFGASLVAWKALVYAGGVDESQVRLETIGFTQAAAVSEGRVDAALDYVSNGPVQLRLAGREVDIIPVADYIDLPANGLVTNDQLIAENPDLVQRMVNALLVAFRYTLDNPDEAFAISLRAVPEAGGDNEAASRAVFDASLPLWGADQAELGRSDPLVWQRAAEFMLEMSLIDTAVATEGIVTNQFTETTPGP
jgi:NitT/TauT family transport system substrate-binding protein